MYRSLKNLSLPDEETLRAWENMRIEILHELQDGASADVPDAELDELGTLVARLASWRTQKKLRSQEALKRTGKELAKNVN
jgi:hypothetical protein